MDVIISCQGGDYTNDIFPKLRASGWDGYWIDAASSLRMKDDAVIVLDPVNRGVIDAALARGVKNRSEEHTSELQSLMRISYAVFCLTTKKKVTRSLEQYPI